MISLLEILKTEPSLELIKGNQEHLLESIGHHLNSRSHCLYFIKNRKFIKRLQNSFEKKSLENIALIVDKGFYERTKEEFSSFYDIFSSLLSSTHVDVSISKCSKPFYDEKYKNLNTQLDGRQLGSVDIHPTAKIAQNVFIGENVTIGANVVIYPHVTILSNSSIGENSIIYPNVAIYHDVQIGKNCRLHGNVTIGADGFGYNFHDYIHHKVWHFSGVIIEDDVEIGANSTVDAGAFIPTRVGSGTKMDNLCTVGHNAQVGQGVVIAGTAGCAGSSVVGDFCFIGGAAKIGPDVSIGKGTLVAAGTLVTSDWPAGSQISGFPAQDHKEWLREKVQLKRILKQKEDEA